MTEQATAGVFACVGNYIAGRATAQPVTCPGITATIIQTIGTKEHDGMALVAVV